jgi:hypothetical protein
LQLVVEFSWLPCHLPCVLSAVLCRYFVLMAFQLFCLFVKSGSQAVIYLQHVSAAITPVMVFVKKPFVFNSCSISLRHGVINNNTVAVANAPLQHMNPR